jgi:hypothetical protein
MRAAWIVSVMTAMALSMSCAGSVPAGASCTSSGDCETGLACLYALGAGCNASGRCVVPSNDCSGPSTGLSLCGCGAPLDLTCIPGIAALSQRTTTGAACIVDAGTDAGDSAQ